MKYYLGPYIWDGNLYVHPTGATSAIDLRNHEKMSTPNLSNGIGLFTGDINDSNYAELKNISLAKDTWQSLVGYRPEGDTVNSLIFDHLTNGADPKGLDQAKPLMPSARRLNIFLENRLIKTKRFDFGTSPETNKIQAVLQEEYQKVYDNHYEMRKKFLGYHGIKLDLSDPENFLIPIGLPKEKPEKPTTVLNESFNGSDKAQLGQDLTWAEGGIDNWWDNFNNHGRRINIAANEDRRMSYATATLSGTDQECTTNLAVQDNNEITYAGPAVRRNGITITFYANHLIRNVGGGNTIAILKVINNNGSIISSTIGVSLSIPYESKLQVIGSDLKSFVDSVLQNSVTDTAIPGGLQCGLWGRRNTSAEVEFDDFLANDIVIGLPIPITAHHRKLLES